LYKNHRGQFLSWASQHYQLHNEEAKDIYQEVFIAIWNNIHSGKLEAMSSSFSTYIFGIGKNQIHNYLRKQQRLVTFSDTSVINPSYDPATMNDDRDYNRKLVENNLEKLSETDRKVLELFYLEEMDMKSIAEEMGYKNADVAKKKKYEAFKKLIQLVKANIKLFSLFII
jgi:RNA polymerase sigma factor (sigma-70 family)